MSDYIPVVNGSPMGLVKHGHFRKGVALQRFNYMIHRH